MATTRYACLLRGVNVSGARKITMSALRSLCESLGHADVETYLQSGNIVVSTRAAQSKLGPALSEAIGKEFGHADVDVFVLSAADLETIIKKNPLARGRDPKWLHVTFLEKDVKPAAFEAIERDRYLPDEFAIGPRVIYLFCPNGQGRTKLNNAFFERKLGLRATTRNWQTTNNLWKLARGGV